MGLLDLVGAWVLLRHGQQTFPRNVHIMYDGKMNKAATQLYKEFEKSFKGVIMSNVIRFRRNGLAHKISPQDVKQRLINQVRMLN